MLQSPLTHTNIHIYVHVLEQTKSNVSPYLPSIFKSITNLGLFSFTLSPLTRTQTQTYAHTVISLTHTYAQTIVIICFPFSFTFSIQLKKKTLEVTVWDYDRSSSNDFLGEVSAFGISTKNSKCQMLNSDIVNSGIIFSMTKAFLATL